MLKFFKYLLPHGLFVLEQRRRHAIQRDERLEQSQTFDKHKREYENSKTNAANTIERFDYEDSIKWLVGLGIPEDQVRAGSIPEISLKKLSDLFQQKYVSKNPLLGIHIGNFLGVSLASLCQSAKDIHSNSTIVSIDPNIPHRGVDRPNDIAIKLIKRYRLEQTLLNVEGFSLDKSLSNDGVVYDEKYDPYENYENESSAENQLEVLSRIMYSKADFILLDGNHNSHYLKKEMEFAFKLLKPKGWLILDDVDDNWLAIKNVFNDPKDGFQQVFTDNRIGILEAIKP